MADMSPLQVFSIVSVVDPLGLRAEYDGRVITTDLLREIGNRATRLMNERWERVSCLWQGEGWGEPPDPSGLLIRAIHEGYDEVMLQLCTANMRKVRIRWSSAEGG
jgi:hypothetical protein